MCGSAPLTALLAKRSASELGRAPLVRYGLTETGLNVSHIATAASRPGSVGIPLPGVLVRLWAESAAAPPGADGEIQIRGPHVFHGYSGNPSATAEAFTADGWFRTGDIGRLDPATGHLVIRGRIKEMIITGGLNVYPREVETVLEEHPSVAEAAVAGVPHPHWGEQVTAWVTLRPGHDFDEAALIAHARTALAGLQVPQAHLPAPRPAAHPPRQAPAAARSPRQADLPPSHQQRAAFRSGIRGADAGVAWPASAVSTTRLGPAKAPPPPTVSQPAGAGRTPPQPSRAAPCSELDI